MKLSTHHKDDRTFYTVHFDHEISMWMDHTMERQVYAEEVCNGNGYARFFVFEKESDRTLFLLRWA